VEIYERGAWWPGSMLGWRHDNRGACQAWVRVEFAGVVEDAWVDLTLLRLPEVPRERHLALAREPKGAAAVHRSGRSDAAPAPQSAEVTQTQHLPLVRDGGAPAAGRRVPPTGGRRRAPETSEQPAVAAPAVPTPAVPTPAVPMPAVPMPAGEDPAIGRHRAPAEAGRHRATDTGMPSAVPAGTGLESAIVESSDRWAPPPPRSELPPAGPVVRSQPARPQLEHDLFTRPMRLDDAVGTVRRSRRDTLTGV
jgi:hypothetical protein